MKYDLIIKGGTIVSMNPSYELFEDTAICIKDGLIQKICPTSEIDGEAAEVIDAEGHLVTPGFVNCHSHLPMTYLRGLADDLPLFTWLNEHIWPMEGKLLSSTFVYDSSLHGIAESILNGVTTTADFYFLSEETAKAMTKVGMRGVLSRTFIDPNGERGIDEHIQFLKRMDEEYRDNPLIDWAIAPHAIYTVSSNLLKQSAEYALAEDKLLHIHLSETKKEVEDCLKEHGKRPLHYLADLGFLELKALFAHGVHLDESELKLMEGTNLAVSVCTNSNLKLVSGFAPLKLMEEHNICYGIGTDGVASNNKLDILEELSTTAKLHKALNEDPVFLPAKEAFAKLTIEAARALGKDKLIGSLEEGKAADILLIDHRKLFSSPLYDPYSHLVYAIGREQITDVFISGNRVLKNRRLTTVCEEDIYRTALSYKEKIVQMRQS